VSDVSVDLHSAASRLATSNSLDVLIMRENSDSENKIVTQTKDSKMINQGPK